MSAWTHLSDSSDDAFPKETASNLRPDANTEVNWEKEKEGDKEEHSRHKKSICLSKSLSIKKEPWGIGFPR